MSEDIPDPVDWANLTPEPSLDEAPSDPREAFAMPDFRAHGRAKRKLFTGRNKDDGPARSPRTVKARQTIPNRKGQFVEPLTKMYITVGGIIAIRDPHCGRVIVMQAEAAAVALDDLAYTDEFIRRMLWAVTQTGKYGAVLAAHAPILFAIAIHHVPAVSEAVSYMGQAFADSVIRGEGMNNADGSGPRDGDGAA